ncbi:MAG TPA: OB-fold nucleic acid binding domain-containing protein [Bryobacteraceae bacterium]|nr:OB-fold nucleic acid binding domain-containing protein [Bryobacteraceae bacterium]HPT24925.1 OB-fold nucleic acid binding domain-containing protein [Bryobacteraceae bacterium]
MKSPNVADLEPRQQITGLFLVQSKDVRQKKTGEPYLSLQLIDRTGDIDAKMWDGVAEIVDTFNRDDFVRVKGETQLYQNRLQLTVHRITKVDDREVDLADFLPASKRDLDEMMAELRGYVSEMRNPHLKSLLDAILSDARVAAAFKKAPAAKSIHHAWLGGLIEHVLSLARLAKFTSAHYTNIDADLLMTGVILHDIGKIDELNYERSFSYSSEGQLLGHMQIALRLIGDKVAAMPDFPVRLRNLVEHLILSHHGQLEFGSPKLPAFPEALLLHHLDNMDSKMEAIRSAIEKERAMPGEWTGFVFALDRQVMDKDKYLAPPAPRVTPKPDAKPATAMGAKLQMLGDLFAEDKP